MSSKLSTRQKLSTVTCFTFAWHTHTNFATSHHQINSRTVCFWWMMILWCSADADVFRYMLLLLLSLQKTFNICALSHTFLFLQLLLLLHRMLLEKFLLCCCSLLELMMMTIALLLLLLCTVKGKQTHMHTDFFITYSIHLFPPSIWVSNWMEFTFGKEKKREKIEELRGEGKGLRLWLLLCIHIYTLYI